MQARRIAQYADARHRMAGKLGQRLPAQAGAAGAEQHDIGRACRQPAGGLFDAVEVVTLRGQPQQRQSAVGMPRPQPVERALAAFQRSGESIRRDTFGADACSLVRCRSIGRRAWQSCGRPPCLYGQDGLVIISLRTTGLVGGNALRPPHDGDQHAALEQPLRDALGVFQSYRIDQRAAPVDIIDTQAVELDLQQCAGDLVGGVEVQGVSALEIGFRLGEFLFRRPAFRHALISLSITVNASAVRSARVAVPPIINAVLFSQTRLSWML